MVRRLVGLGAVLLGVVVAAPACADRDDVTAALQAAVDDGVPGAVAVVRTDDSVVQYSAGVANIVEQSAFTPRMHVRAASITKTFVATVVLQLVDAGAVDLDALVSQYLPQLRPHAVTVRQLLRHQTGLAEYFDPGSDPDDYSGPVDLASLVDAALAKPVVFAPGSQMAYTNTNYLVAGLLIEAVAGRSAVDEVMARIVEPLGLSDTYFPAAGDTGLAAPFVSGYEDADGERVDETAFPAALAGTAGGMVSSGEDITAFISALLAGELIPAELLEQMMQTVPQPGTIIGYGLGLASFTLPCGVEVWGHGGDLEGYHSLMVKPVEPADAPALAVTVTQSPDADGLLDDPREKVAEALYC